MATDKVTVDALVEISTIFVEAIASAGPMGAPGGHLYAASMSVLSLEQFQSIMALLCRTGLIEKRGECYHKVNT